MNTYQLRTARRFPLFVLDEVAGCGDGEDAVGWEV